MRVKVKVIPDVKTYKRIYYKGYNTAKKAGVAKQDHIRNLWHSMWLDEERKGRRNLVVGAVLGALAVLYAYGAGLIGF